MPHWGSGQQQQLSAQAGAARPAPSWRGGKGASQHPAAGRQLLLAGNSSSSSSSSSSPAPSRPQASGGGAITSSSSIGNDLQVAEYLKGLLGYAWGTASINLYMAHGGTNFGFWAGAAPGPDLQA